MAQACGIVSLLTDFGLRDGYVGAMKGVMLGIDPELQLVDISHQIERHDIVLAAQMLGHLAGHFPTGTVHLAVVDPGVGSERRALAVETEDYFFIGPDNGLFTVALQKHPPLRLVAIESSPFLPAGRSDTFHGRDVFAPVAAHCAAGVRVEQFGRQVDEYRMAGIPVPRRRGTTLQGEIITADHFGNLVTNISRGELETFCHGAEVHIEVGRTVISGLSRSYLQAGRGSPLAIINSWDHLEVAVSGGDARRELGVERGQAVLVRRRAGE
jgi:S-adenosylmethionine hydrolase